MEMTAVYFENVMERKHTVWQSILRMLWNVNTLFGRVQLLKIEAGAITK
jgi:hypothetical protein